MQSLQYKSEVCASCGQSTTYILPVDLGTLEILQAVANAIRKKGVNEVHPRREMELKPQEGLPVGRMAQEGYLTSNQVGNLSRPRFHGLIASIDGRPGWYCLTRKGAAFLRGANIPKYAIVSKALGRQIGYWNEQDQRITARELVKSDLPRWELDIVDGRVVNMGSLQNTLNI